MDLRDMMAKVEQETSLKLSLLDPGVPIVVIFSCLLCA